MAKIRIGNAVAVKRKLELREKLWPGVTPEHLWDRKNRDGYATVPRLLPLMLTIMNDLSDKGHPVGSVYLELWCRLGDEGFLSLSRPQEMAFGAGLQGQRALYTWRDRMAKLRALKFLDIKSGPFGDFSYALFWNPYHVIRAHHEAGRVGDAKWQALIFRASEIGADDIDDEIPALVSPKSKTKTKPKTSLAKR